MASFSFVITGSVHTRVTITEQPDGSLLVHLKTLTAGQPDLRALYFDLSNEQLLSGLSFQGAHITGFAKQANGVSTVGGDTNINGQVIKQFGNFDVGVAFGGPGNDGLTETSFVIRHNSAPLTLDLLNLQDFGVRTQSDKAGGTAPAAPMAVDDAATVSEDMTLSINILANDQDRDGGSHTVAKVNGSAGNVGAPFNVTSASGQTATVLVASNGQVTFDPRSAFNWLAAGESDQISFSYTVVDGQGNSDIASVVLTVTGANDGPAIVTAQSNGAISGNGVASAIGSIAYSDADLSDGHSVEVSATAEGYLGSFTAIVTNASTGDGAGAVQWSFLALPAELEFLAAGETRTQTYTVGISDGHGGLVAQMVTITITGTNDAPAVTSAVTSGAVEEDSATSASGGIAFADVDLIDVHTVSVTPTASGYLGAFAASVSNASTGDGSGAVTWDFAVDNGVLEFLAAGEIRTQTYTVTISDGHGGSIAQTVTITITGTNDAPVVTGAVTGATTEDGEAVTLDALANASDVDAGAMLSVVDVPGTLPAGVTYNPATHSFTLDPANAAYQSLVVGATTTVSVTYGVSDGAVTTPASVSWTVTGTNDAPLAAGDTAATNEDNSVTITVLTNDSDVDGDTLTITQIDGQAATVGVAVNLASGGAATLNADNTITYSPAANANGQKTFSYTTSDGHGGAQTATVTVDVAPVAGPAAIAIGHPPEDVRVNTTTAGTQAWSSIAGMADGGYLVTWASGSGPRPNILAQRYDASENPVATEFQVNGSPTHHELVSAQITTLTDGRFVITWWGTDDSTSGVRGRIFNADGTPSGAEFLANSFTSNQQQYGTVAALPDGGFIVVWSSEYQLDRYDIYAQRYDATGARVGTEVRLNTYTSNDQFGPSVAVFPDGSYVVGWSSQGQDGAGWGAYQQRFQADGTPMGAETRINTITAGDQMYPNLAVLAGGGYVAVWMSGGADGSGFGVSLQRFDVSGAPVGVETRVNTYVANDQQTPQVLALADGGYFIAWTSNGQDGAGLGLYGQRYDSAGNTVGGEIRINTTTAGDQGNHAGITNPSLIQLPNGSIVATFYGDGEVYTRTFGLGSEIVGAEDTTFAVPITITPTEPGETVTQTVLSGLPEGSVLSAGVSSDNGMTWTFAGSPPADLTLTPPANYNGTFTLSVTATTQDGSDTETTTASRPVTITPINDVPVVTGAVTAAATEDGAGVTLNALANASDVDMGATLSVVDVPGVLPAGVTYNPAAHSFTLDPANAAYQPLAAGATTTVSVAYGVSDGTVTTPASVSWTVTGANDAPVAVVNTAATNEDTSVTIEVLGNDTDVDGDALTITQIDGQAATVGVAVNLASGGAATLNADNTITYSPAANANGQKTFSYTTSDGHGGAHTATVTVNVAPVAGPANIRFGNTAPLTPLDAGDVLVSSAVAQRETASTVQALADGGYVIAWSGFGVGAGFGDTFLQRYSASGERVGPEIKVNSTNSLYEWVPSIAALGDGGYVVAWTTELGDGSGRGITAQRFAADGSRVGAEFRVNTTTAGAQQSPVVTELPDGGFLAIWYSSGQDGSGDGIYGQRFTLAGAKVGGEFRINSTTAGDQFTPAVATLPDGGFVVSWVSNGQDGSGSGIFGQRYDANGNPVGSEFTVNSSVAGDQYYPDVAALSDGGYVITWSSLGGQDGDGWGVFGQRYSASGSAVGSEFLVNTYTAGEQRLQSVIGLPDGGFLVTWASRGQDGSGFGMFGQRFDSAGAPVGSELHLNANSAGNQFNDQNGGAYSIALTTDGTLVQLFTDDRSVFMRRFDTSLQQDGREDEAFGITVQVSPTESGETVTQTILSGLPEGSVLSAGATSDNGQTWTFTGSPPANLSLTPPANYNGTFTLTVTATTQDGSDTETTTASRPVTVASVNDAPVVTGAVTAAATEDGAAVTLDALANASDVDTGATLSVVDVPGTLPAGVTYAATHSFTLDPADAAYQSLAAGAATTVSVSYGVSDGTVTTPTSVSWTVTGTNDAPVAVGDTAATNEDTSVAIDVLGNDTDVDGDALTITQIDGQAATVGVAVNLASGGAATLNADNTITYAPAANANGQKTFSYTTSDGHGGIQSATVTVDVAPVAGPAEIVIGALLPLESPNAGDVRVNTTTAGIQAWSSIANLANGGYLVSWVSGPGSQPNVFAQRHDPSGVPVGPEFQVNTSPTSTQLVAPQIALLADGRFVITWWGNDNSSSGVRGRIFNADGTPAAGEFLANTFTSNQQQYGTVAALPDGGFVVVWSSEYQLDRYDIYAQRYNASGAPVGIEVRLNTYISNDQFGPSVAVFPDGSYVVGWSSQSQDGSGWGAYQQRFNADGTPMSVETRINTTTAGDQMYPNLAALAGGGYVAVWMSSSADGSGFGVSLQRFDASGAPVGTETRVNTYVANDQQTPQVLALADGGYFVAWTSNGQDGSGLGLYGQRYDSSGSAVGDEIRINATTAGDQGNHAGVTNPSLIQLPNGSIVATFYGDGDVYTHQLTASSDNTSFTVPITITPTEPGETITQTVLSGLPEGSVLSAGVSSDNGQTWSFVGPPPADLTLTPPANYNGTFTLSVSATTQDGPDTETTAASRAVTITPVNAASMAESSMTGLTTEDGSAAVGALEWLESGDLGSKPSDGGNVSTVIAFDDEVIPTFGEPIDFQPDSGTQQAPTYDNVAEIALLISDLEPTLGEGPTEIMVVDALPNHVPNEQPLAYVPAEDGAIV